VKSIALSFNADYIPSWVKTMLQEGTVLNGLSHHHVLYFLDTFGHFPRPCDNHHLSLYFNFNQSGDSLLCYFKIGPVHSSLGCTTGAALQMQFGPFVLQFKVYIYWLVLKLLLIYQACFKSFPKILEIVLWTFCNDRG
jgi:hypothetical protein